MGDVEVKAKTTKRKKITQLAVKKTLSKGRNSTKKPLREPSQKPVEGSKVIESAALDYNVLRTKLNRFAVSQNELNKAQEALEASFLWYRAAVEKVGYK